MAACVATTVTVLIARGGSADVGTVPVREAHRRERPRLHVAGVTAGVGEVLRVVGCVTMSLIRYREEPSKMRDSATSSLRQRRVLQRPSRIVIDGDAAQIEVSLDGTSTIIDAEGRSAGPWDQVVA